MEDLKILGKYLAYWPVFLLSLSLCLGMAFFYLWYTPAKYKVSSTLLIQDDIKGEGVLKGTAFSDIQMFKTAKTVENEMEVLRSRDLIYKILKSLSLETSYSKKQWFKKIEIYGKQLPVVVEIVKISKPAYSSPLSVKILDNNRFLLTNDSTRTVHRFNEVVKLPAVIFKVSKGPAFNVKAEEIYLKFNNLNRMAESYSLSGLSIIPVVKDANTVVISLLDAVPQRGVDILRQLIYTYNKENVIQKNTIAHNTISFIDSRLKYLTADLTAAEEDVESYKQKNKVTDIAANAQMHLDNSGMYRQQLAQSELQLRMVRSIEASFKQPDKNFSQVPSTLGITDPTFNTLTEKYNFLQLERQRLLNNARADNPLVIELSSQLSALKWNMQENLKSIKAGLIIEIGSLRSKLSQFESKIKDVPAIERGLLNRSREQNVKLSLYNYLLQKREETELSLSATVPTSQVIDNPAYKSTPEQPKSTLIYLVACIFGILFPASAIYVKDKVNNKVRFASDIREISGAKVLGELGNKGKAGSVVVRENSRTNMSELFRYIRSNLKYINNELNNQVMLVTSSIQGEGKTFFSINLGLTLSQTNKKVIVLEFDLRKPDLLKSIKLKSPLGITDYLNSDDVDLDDIIKKTDLSSNLHVIGCGTRPENPAEMFLSPKLEMLFANLKMRFDYVIIDTSPVGQVADAFNLAEYTNSTIYLVRYNFTDKYQLKILEDIYHNEKLKNTLVVLNDAKLENRNVYGYGRYSYS